MNFNEYFEKANEGLEKPIIGLLIESTFDNFKYLKEFTMKYYSVTRDTSVIDSLNKYQMMF